MIVDEYCDAEIIGGERDDIDSLLLVFVLDCLVDDQIIFGGFLLLHACFQDHVNEGL